MRLLKLLPNSFAAKLLGSQNLMIRLGWTTIGYILVQLIRFAQNLILTRLIAPELFGIMVILTSLRVGVELFTDVGIGQNVIASPRGTEPRFYNTAWTLQMLRGVFLAGLFLPLLPLLRHYYDDPMVGAALPALCLLFLLSGAHGMGPTLATKAMQSRKIAVYNVACTAFGSMIALGLAWLYPTVWGLVAGNILSTVASSALSYMMFSKLTYQIRLDREAVRSIFSFGKWIFLSSIVFFLSTNFDRLVLSKYVALGLLGIYGVARSLGDIVGQFSLQLGNLLIFPSISSAGVVGHELQSRISWLRMTFLLAMALALALLIGLSDVIIRILYDDRYLAAGPVLAWIGVSTWIFVMNTVGENLALGIRRPVFPAMSHGAKFVCLVIGLPIAVSRYGIAGAAIATVGAELARYVVLTGALAREKIHFVRQDLVCTGALILAAIAVRELVHLVGLSSAASPFLL